MHTLIRRLMLFLLKVYQKFFTLFSYGSCRYYPTCSEYAKWQILHNSMLKAIWYSTLRVLRCNQLFSGGIEYPVVKKNFVEHKLQRKRLLSVNIIFWFVPKDTKYFYVIKSFRNPSSKKDHRDR